MVDDDADTREIFHHHLKKAGFRPLCVSSAGECFRLLAEVAVDLVLLDLLMPGVDGLQALKTINASPSTRRVPVVVISACDDQKVLRAAIELGAKEYLIKPVLRRQLIRVAREWS